MRNCGSLLEFQGVFIISTYWIDQTRPNENVSIVNFNIPKRFQSTCFDISQFLIEFNNLLKLIFHHKFRTHFPRFFSENASTFNFYLLFEVSVLWPSLYLIGITWISFLNLNNLENEMRKIIQICVSQFLLSRFLCNFFTT